VIYFNNVSKAYKDGLALDDITLKIVAGEFVSIIGHSGAGKTTLTKMIVADENPSQGTVFFESINVHELKSKDLTKLRRRIGVVFQDFKLLSNKTAYENIAFAMEAVGKTDEEIKSDVPHVLELVDLSSRLHHFPNQMSGGEQQRLAIARAIINQPELIIADEPTGNLDPINTHEIVQILKKINDLGTTVILATHNRGVIDSVGKRVVTMEKGKIADINFTEIIQKLYAQEAYFVMKNTAQLSSEGFEEIKIIATSSEDIEHAVIKEHLQQSLLFDQETELHLFTSLLTTLNITKKEGETITDFHNRIEDEMNKLLQTITLKSISIDDAS